MQIKLNKISQIAAEIFKKLGKNHRFEPIFWEIFKNLLMRCAHFSMLLKYMKPIDFFFSKSMYIVSKYQSISRHQFEQYFVFVQQLTLHIVETKGFTTVFDNQSGKHRGRQEVSCRIHRGGVLPVVQMFDSAQPCPPPRTSSSAHARYAPFYPIFVFTS